MRRFLLVASVPIESEHDVAMLKYVSGVDLIELRVDYLDNPLAIDYTRLPKNIIVTLRDQREGGVKHHADAVKLALLDTLNKYNILYDVEIGFVKRYNVNYRNKIVSVHIMEPEKVDLDMVERDVKTYSAEAFVVKVATKPFPGYRSFLTRLLEIGENIAVMPMGTSYMERLAFALLGSRLLYCYVSKPTALGQPKCDEIKGLLAVLGLEQT